MYNYRGTLNCEDGALIVFWFCNQEQVLRVRKRYLQLKDNLSQYVYLDSLRDRNETLFYRLLMEDVKELGMSSQPQYFTL